MPYVLVLCFDLDTSPALLYRIVFLQTAPLFIASAGNYRLMELRCFMYSMPTVDLQDQDRGLPVCFVALSRNRTRSLRKM